MKSKNQNLFANPDKSGQVVRRIVALGVVCMLLFAFVSCDASDPSDITEEDIPFDTPIDVPFTELSLLQEVCECRQWACTWVRVNTESELVVINSDNELRRHVNCVKNLPVIDFSRHTLLLARGVEGHLVGVDLIELQQLSSRNFTMTINLFPGAGSAITHWHVAIVTRKLERTDNVKLNVTMNWTTQ